MADLPFLTRVPDDLSVQAVEVGGAPAVVFMDEVNNTAEIFFDRNEERVHVAGPLPDVDILINVAARVDVIAGRLAVDLDGLGLTVIGKGSGSSSPVIGTTAVWGSGDQTGIRDLTVSVTRPAIADPASTMWFGRFESTQIAGIDMWHSVSTSTETSATFQNLVFVLDGWLVEMAANDLTEEEFLNSAASLIILAPEQLGRQ